MVQVAAGRRVAAALAAAVLSFIPASALAQDIPELDEPLDPSAPLEPLPDLGVDWPDMEGNADGLAEDLAAPSVDGAAERSYQFRLTGLNGVAAGELDAQFKALSALEANRNDPANAAQLDRRARQDAELLAELLRAYGYYDAGVEPRIESVGDAVQVTLAAQPGPLYTYADVRLPGLETAPDAAALKAVFAVDPGEPVNAAAATAG
jgi:translocation and assembly module TamA